MATSLPFSTNEAPLSPFDVGWRVSEDITMRASLLFLLLPTSLARPEWAAAQQKSFAYAPGVARYKVTTVQHRQQIMGGGRAPFDFDVTTNQWVALTITPVARDTLKLSFTVDSVAVTSNLDAPPPDLAVYRGRKLDGTMSPQGRVYAFAPARGDTNPAITQLYSAYSRFLVPVRVPALAKGVTWADTSIARRTGGKYEITTTTVTTYRVTGDTTIGGRHAWRVELASTIAHEGKGSEAGQPLYVTGGGTSTGVHFLSDQGVFLGSQSSQRTEIQERMNESEGTPIEQTFKSTVELLSANH